MPGLATRHLRSDPLFDRAGSDPFETRFVDSPREAYDALTLDKRESRKLGAQEVDGSVRFGKRTDAVGDKPGTRGVRMLDVRLARVRPRAMRPG